MKLREWRETHGHSQQFIADKVGAKSSTVVSRWERLVHVPHPDQVAALFVLTDGAVTPNDHYELPDLRKRRRAA